MIHKPRDIRIHSVIFFIILCVFFPLSIEAETKNTLHRNLEENLIALQGYDPVSYFSGTPQEGNEKFVTIHKGARYQFVNKENMTLFEVTPEKFLPAYGGWCAWAMLEGDKIDVNPQRFKIINGINYLFYDGFWGNTLKKWEKLAKKKTEKVLVDQADQHWQKLINL